MNKTDQRREVRERPPNRFLQILLAPFSAIFSVFSLVLPQGDGTPLGRRTYYFLTSWKTWVVVGAIGASAWFIIPRSTEPQTPENSQLSSVSNSITDHSKLIETGSEVELFKELKRLNLNFGSLAVPGKIGRLEQQLEIIDRLEKMDLGDSLRDDVITAKLLSLIAFERIAISNDMAQDWVTKDLAKITNDNMGSNQPQIKSLAVLGSTMLQLHKFIGDKSSENLKNLKAQIESGIPALATDEDSLNRMVSIVDLFKEHATPNQSDNLYSFVGEQLKTNATPEIAALGARLVNKVRTGNAGFNNLITKIRFKDKEAIKAAHQFIQSVSAGKNASVVDYCQAFLLTEAFQKAGYRKQATAIFGELFASVDKVTESHADPLKQMRDHFRTLQTLKGNKFEFSLTDTEGKIVERQADQPVVIFFVDQKSESAKDLRQTINNLKYFRSQGVMFLGIPVKPNVNSYQPSVADSEIATQIKGYQRANPHVTIPSVECSKELLKRLPVYSSTYIIVLDKTGTVIGTNVDSDKLRIGLESILKDRP